MVAGCGSKVAKVLLVLLNIIFLLVGAALLGVGIWMLVNNAGAHYQPLLGKDGQILRISAIVLTAAGAFIFLVSLFGFVGACCENTCMLLTYAVIVFLMFLVQLAAGILAAIYVNKIGDWLENQMNVGIQEYKDVTIKKTAIDGLQVGLKCCGVKDSGDWSDGQNTARNTTWTNDFPPSCCKLQNPDAQPVESNFASNCKGGVDGSYYKNGCYESLKAWLKKNAIIIAGVAFGLVLIEILVIVMACCLRNAILREKEGTV